jgi:hypothetical protein
MKGMRAYKTSVKNPDGIPKPLAKRRSKWEENIKTDLN